MADDKPRNDLSYEAALHGMQAGVAMWMQKDPDETAPKHLRVGINSSMVSHTALMRLLVAKGLVTWDEFEEELRLEANRELDRYEDALSHHHGTNVTLR